MIEANGQTIGLPLSSSYTHVDLLATAVNGNTPSQTFTVDYTTAPRRSLPKASAIGTRRKDTPMSGRCDDHLSQYPQRPQDNKGPFDIYGYSFALTIPSGFDIESITLPNDQHVQIVAITVA